MISGACHRCFPLLILHLALILSHHLVTGQDWLLNSIIPSDYDVQQAPLESDDDLLTVHGTIWLRRLDADEDQRSVHTNMILCLQWKDYRLQEVENDFETLKVDHDQIHLFWTPQVLFRNALSSKQVITLQNNEFVLVSLRQKLLKYCSQLNVQFKCIFKLSNFPFDSQLCDFQLENIKHASNIHLTLRIFSDEQATPQFKLHDFQNGSCSANPNDRYQQRIGASSGNCAFVSIRLVRHLSIYIIRYYLLTLLIVMICYVQFWVSHEDWADRVMFNVEVMRVLIDVSDDSFEEVPSHTVVSLFWWLGFMQLFVYMGLLEFIISQVWIRHQIDKKRTLQISNETNIVYKKSCLTALLHKLVGPFDFFENMYARNKVDYCARFIFPIVVLLFIIIYVLSTVPEFFAQY